MFGREVVERQQLVLNIGDPLDHLGGLRAELLGEHLNGLGRVLPVFGIPGLLQRPLRRRLDGLGQAVQDMRKWIPSTQT